MKQIFALMLFLVCTHLLAQDQIVMKNGDEINGKVTEVLDEDVKYKKAENPDGPTYSLKKADVLFIKYQNGTKENFVAQQEKEQQQDNTLSPSKNKVSRVEAPAKTKERREIDKSKASLPRFIIGMGSNLVMGYHIIDDSFGGENFTITESFDRMTLYFEGYNRRRTFSFEAGTSFNFQPVHLLGFHIMPIGWVAGNNYVQAGLGPKIDFITYFGFYNEFVNTYTLNAIVNVNPIPNLNIRLTSGVGGGLYLFDYDDPLGLAHWSFNFSVGGRF
ncbi:MAG: hypothetical protein IPM47_16585 [Sphingobacteriales bacterium]|nr:MAG: hypothetical protein IPM47_16585 [Sphingobacteriales bacterium]